MKSMPGRTELAATAVTSTIESPYRITTEPSDCLAMRPVSMDNSRPPNATPARTNILLSFLRRPGHPFVPHLEGPCGGTRERRQTVGKKDERSTWAVKQRWPGTTPSHRLEFG